MKVPDFTPFFPEGFGGGQTESLPEKDQMAGSAQ
jgi:hypothetical protein